MESTMVDTPAPGTDLSELAGVEALAKIRQAALADTQDKPKSENSDEAPQVEAADAAAEPEPVDGEGEATSDETQETTQEGSGESEAEAEVIITLPTGEKINAEEAARGYLRQSDYTRKTQELARERQALAAEKAEVIPKLRELVANLDAQAEKEPDWLKLAQEKDPWEFQKLRTEWEVKRSAHAAARAQLEAAQKQALAQAQQQARDALLQGAFDKSWKTPEGLKKGLEQVAAWAVDQGFPPEALSTITDPNVIITLEKARRYDELQKTRVVASKVVKDKPKPIKPGPKPAVNQSEREFNQVKNRFHQTKTDADALALLRKVRERGAASLQ